MPTYPYISVQRGLVETINQLRKGFPGKVDAGYLKRFNIAPANESFVISILRFLGLIDEEGAQQHENADYFFSNSDDVFKPGLEKTVRAAYSQVFHEMGDDAVTADKGALANWFRAADKTTELIGQRQAATFRTLTALAGYGDVPDTRTNRSRNTSSAMNVTGRKSSSKRTISTGEHSKKAPISQQSSGGQNAVGNTPDIGLAVRIEINLPADADPDTYDAIFASIKKRLMS